MLVLNTTTRTIQVVLAGTVATRQLPITAAFRDINSTDYIPGPTALLTNNTTPVDAIPAPASGTQRVIDYLSIYNDDTVTHTVSVRLNDNGTTYLMVKHQLAVGERLEYVDGQGFSTYTITGAEKVSLNQGSAPITTGWQQSVLAADVTNNNATANSIADVVGLSFPVNAGSRYHFNFVISYTAAATATGSRWSINGPSTTYLSYRSEYSLTTTTRTINDLVAYDQPTASNASSAATTGNMAIIEGFVIPSANGSIIARFASEVSSSAIIAKAGSVVSWISV